MDSTVMAVVITAVPSTLAGAAAVITATSNKRNSIDKMRRDISDIKNDMSATKEASFYALEAHVENGANGDVKKAYNRLKKNIFSET